MSESIEPRKTEIRREDIRRLTQGLVLIALALCVVGVAILIFSGVEWYMPTLALIVGARFGYDRFFAR